MSASPAVKRLKLALSTFAPEELAAIGKRAGVNTRAVQRAAAGTQVRADHYLKLCASLGIDCMAGDRVEPRRLGDLDWRLLGLGLHLTRKIRKVLTIRAAAKKIGKSVSVSMLSRVENGHPVSISGVIAICKFIGTRPEQYAATPEMFHGKPKTETRARVSA